MTPILIVTRPDPQGAAFAAAIRQAWDGPLHIILSPLLQIVPVHVGDDLSDLGGVIFTSVNGVAQAARLGLRKDIPAYCVGDKTATAAAAAGFATKTGPGDAAQLTDMILADRPAGPLAHIRGRHARGNIAGDLTDKGIFCRDVIAYDQQALPLTEAAEHALQGKKPVVVPLFSARTCTIFESGGPFAAPLYLVAISAAAMTDQLAAVTRTIAAALDGSAMIDATLGCLREIVDRNG